MAFFKTSLLVGLTVLALPSCGNSDSGFNAEREKELALKEQRLAIREKELAQSPKEASQKTRISTTEAVKQATAQFEAYLPKILATHEDAVLDVQQPYTGDFTGDGIEDVAIYFSLSPNGGGNALVGQGMTLYQNMGDHVKVLAGYEPDYLFSMERISEGYIHVLKLGYAEGDGRCCPSVKKPYNLTIEGGRAF
jgi:hypothetical protein